MSRGKSQKNFECGHRGFGKLCHRCEEADRLMSFAADTKKKFITNKKKKDKKLHKTWTIKDLTEEADRLRDDGRRYLSNG